MATQTRTETLEQAEQRIARENEARIAELAAQYQADEIEAILEERRQQNEREQYLSGNIHSLTANVFGNPSGSGQIPYCPNQ